MKKKDNSRSRIFRILDGSTEFALLESMAQSKILTIMVVVMLSLFGLLFWFLFDQII